MVAIVPAHERQDTVGETVRALLDTGRVDSVLVVDDGSADATSRAAAAAGARVLRLVENRGKGGAVAAGLDALGADQGHDDGDAADDADGTEPGAWSGCDVVALIDADTGASASEVTRLLSPVLDGTADMAVAVLPPAGGRGGFGLVRDLAAAGIFEAVGRDFAAPLSGQRAMPLSLARSLTPAPRFGLEVGLTIDAVRRGARVVEVPTAFDHRHTGRSLGGFLHRMRQGRDLVLALLPRIGPGGTARALWRTIGDRLHR